MRALGQALMWLGFLGGSFAAVARLEDPDDKWATVPWLWYGVGIGIGIVGIVLLRRANQADDADDAKTEAEYSVIQQSLDRLSTAVASLCQDSQRVPGEVLSYIDEQCAEPLSDFANARQALVKRFGMTVYADVMTEFACAERYVNRTWSAAADGYIDEVNASIRRAQQHLVNASNLLTSAEQELA